MVIVLVCAAMLAAGLVLAVRWRALTFCSPPPLDAPSAPEVARRYAWYCSVLLAAGASAGTLVMGAGGRLAMRLLAVTGGDEAQGRLTEAKEVVGEVTVGGTIGFIVFIGVFGGVIAAVAYLVVRRLLPPAWLGGLAFGAILLVVLGTTLDPLRDDNPDFDLVGPGWLAVLVFTALALAFGVTLAAFSARLSSWLPLPSRDRRVLVRYAPIAFAAVLGISATAALVVLGVLVVAATRWSRLVQLVRSPTTLRVGRIALVAIVVVSLPGAAQSIGDIAGRGRGSSAQESLIVGVGTTEDAIASSPPS